MNKLVLAGALSLGLVTVASAQNHIYITGSTAFRGATYNAIIACYDGGVVSGVAAWKCSGASSVPAGLIQAQTAGYMNFYGTMGGVSTIVKCAWSGSEAGYLDVVNCTTTTENFMPDTIAQEVTTTDPSSGTPAWSTYGPADNHAVDIAMADNSQAYCKTKTPAIVNSCKAGIIPFTWAKNAQETPFPADWSRILNVSEMQARVAIKSGGIRTAQLTGNSADTKWLYVAGRDNNSGTRVNTLLTLGLPTTQVVDQVQISGSDGNVTVTDVANGGQSSGGTLAGTMGWRGSATSVDNDNGGGATGWYAIAYLGMTDAYTAVNANGGAGNGAVLLTLDGVAESTAAVEQGQYPLWGTEYCSLANCDSTTSPAGVLWTCLCGKWTASGITTDPYEIPSSNMHCKKTSDAADPVHN